MPTIKLNLTIQTDENVATGEIRLSPDQILDIIEYWIPKENDQAIDGNDAQILLEAIFNKIGTDVNNAALGQLFQLIQSDGESGESIGRQISRVKSLIENGHIHQ